MVARQAVRRDETKASARTRERHGTLDEELIRVGVATGLRRGTGASAARIAPQPSCPPRVDALRRRGAFPRAGCQSRHQSRDSLTGRRGRRRTLREIRAANGRTCGARRQPPPVQARRTRWPLAVRYIHARCVRPTQQTRCRDSVLRSTDCAEIAEVMRTLAIGTCGEVGELCLLPPDVAWSAVVALREVAPDGQPHAKRILPLIQRERG